MKNKKQIKPVNTAYTAFPERTVPLTVPRCFENPAGGTSVQPSTVMHWKMVIKAVPEEKRVSNQVSRSRGTGRLRGRSRVRVKEETR